MQSQIETILSGLRHKSILILGYGREGKSSLRFLKHWLPESKLMIADAGDLSLEVLPELNGLQTFTGPEYLEATRFAEVVIKTPGIPGRLLNLTSEQILTSQTDLFLEAFRNKTIGVTGTKGKSTTSSLIHHLLSSSGIHSILTGNIGIPCFDILPYIQAHSRIVFELSANQLEHSTHSPSISVLLNIFEEHLDHFGTFEAYQKAKLNLVLHTKPNDTVIIHKDLIPLIDGLNADVKYIPDHQFQTPFKLKIKGTHNQLNAQAAILAAMTAGASLSKLVEAMEDFTGLPHRLEYLGNHAGIHFYNDSIATIPEATIAALETLHNTDFLILGGFDRGIHYELLTRFLLNHPVRHLFLTGKAGKRIGQMLESSNLTLSTITYFDEMPEVFEQLKKLKKEGDVCLLSPAAASYDRYKNFEHRGDVFRTLVKSFE